MAVHIMAVLARAGLVHSQTGATGGARLARPAQDITLLAIYQAVDEGRIFALHHQPPSATCPVLTSILDRAERALAAELEATMLTDVVRAVCEVYRRWLRESRIAQAAAAPG